MSPGGVIHVGTRYPSKPLYPWPLFSGLSMGDRPLQVPGLPLAPVMRPLLFQQQDSRLCPEASWVAPLVYAQVLRNTCQTPGTFVLYYFSLGQIVT